MRNFWSATIEYSILVKMRKWLFFSEEKILDFAEPLPKYFLAHTERLAKDLVFYSTWWKENLIETLRLDELMAEVISCELIEKVLFVKKVDKITLLDMMSERITEKDFMDYVIERIEGS